MGGGEGDYSRIVIFARSAASSTREKPSPRKMGRGGSMTSRSVRATRSPKRTRANAVSCRRETQTSPSTSPLQAWKAAAQGKTAAEATLEEMDALWEAAKGITPES